MVDITSIPRCLEALLQEKFFMPCLFHEFEKKCEKNTFCLDCCISLCPHCLPLHQNHHLLQIRRYVYQAVIRLRDAQKVIDCSSVQPYTTNSAKVVFMNPRPNIHYTPMIRQSRASDNACGVCGRSLQDPYLFCSLSCKVHHMGTAIITSHSTTHDSILELPNFQKFTSSRSSSRGTNFTEDALVCSKTTAFTKKKRSPISASQVECRPKCAIVAKFCESFKRRKGVPHRSPLY